jgi:hypothetical protein
MSVKLRRVTSVAAIEGKGPFGEKSVRPQLKKMLKLEDQATGMASV